MGKDLVVPLSPTFADRMSLQVRFRPRLEGHCLLPPAPQTTPNFILKFNRTPLRGP